MPYSWNMSSPHGLSEPRRKMLLKAEEVAQRLSVSRAMVYQLIAAGEMPVVKIARRD